MTYLIKYRFQTKQNHISCESKCKFDEAQCNSNQWENNHNGVDLSVKNIIYVEKIIFGILLFVIEEMENI